MKKKLQKEITRLWKTIQNAQVVKNNRHSLVMAILPPCEALKRELQNSYELLFIILISILIKAAPLFYLVGLYRVKRAFTYILWLCF